MNTNIQADRLLLLLNLHRPDFLDKSTSLKDPTSDIVFLFVGSCKPQKDKILFVVDRSVYPLKIVILLKLNGFDCVAWLEDDHFESRDD